MLLTGFLAMGKHLRVFFIIITQKYIFCQPFTAIFERIFYDKKLSV